MSVTHCIVEEWESNGNWLLVCSCGRQFVGRLPHDDLAKHLAAANRDGRAD